MPMVEMVTIRFNFDAGDQVFSTTGTAVYNSAGTSISYYEARFTQEIANKYQPQKPGFLFLGWTITQYNNRNPEGILNIGDSLYSRTSTFYLTSEWQEAQPLVKNRILFKTDTVENWETQENTFETLKGELYFYNDFFDTGKINHLGKKIYKPSLKIGNGNLLSDVNFFQNVYITEEQIKALFGDSSITTNLLDTGKLDSLILGQEVNYGKYN